MKALTSVLNLALSQIATSSSGSSFNGREAVGKNVLLWPAVFEGGIMWRDVDALAALGTTGGGGNMLLSSAGASPWYIRWNKCMVSVPTCLLCTIGRMASFHLFHF